MTSLIAYRKHIDAIHTREITLPIGDGQDRAGQELCTLPDGRTVVVLFDGHELPKDQHETIQASIEALPTPLPDDLKAAIREACPHVRLINTRMQDLIRARYSAEDEMKFSRIGTGQALGMYKMSDAEKAAMVAFGTYLEEQRQWAKGERAKLGV
jgi:hypothetical protein